MLSTERYDVAWIGFVYIDGAHADVASIRRFADEIGANLGTAAAKLKGVYFVAVQDKETKRSFAFVDNSGLYHAYYSPRCVGTSFLDIVSFENLASDDLDPEAAVEFLQFGCIYDGQTLFPQIRKIDPDVVVESLSDGSTATFRKGLPDISEPAHRSLEQILESLAQAITGQTVSLDLTGGIDSRLLATAFSYFGMPFELAASGRSDIEDIEIAHEVARALGREFFVTPHDPRRTDWNDLFMQTDGLFDLAKADRPLQLQQARAARGVTLAISGAGGELFKDFWWLQDFPFYNRKNPSLERLYALRFAPDTPDTGALSPRYRAAAERTRGRILRAMSQHSVAGNTKTYDRIYYGLKMREFAGRFLTNSSGILPMHAPYLDREAVSVGYSLDRSQRFFNRFHRELITRYSPEVAGIRTTEGRMTASSAPLSVSTDMLKYVANRFSRLKTKIYQRRGLRVHASPGPDSPQLRHILDELVHARKTIQRLQDYGILDKEASLAYGKAPSLGSLLAIDMLLERLESMQRENRGLSYRQDHKSYILGPVSTPCLVRAESKTSQINGSLPRNSSIPPAL